MRTWNLGADDPLALILAADARLSVLKYADDQIWELSLSGGDPGAVTLRTTFGLRARGMRMFPRFVEDNTTRNDPADFETAPRLKHFYPNFIELAFSPFVGIDVVTEYWVPESYAVAGRLRIINNGVTPRKLRMEWVAILSPAGEGRPMAPKKLEAVTVLSGDTEGLAPVLFLTGGPQGTSSPYPSLDHEVALLPGQSRSLTWVLAAKANEDASFRSARAIATRNWEAERARIEMLHAAQLHVTTGDPDWDTAFALGQKAALNLIHGPNEQLTNASFVSARLPDLGYSGRGDGTDYNYLWNGQSALEAWYLAGLLLPYGAQIATGILHNFIAVQAADGRIDGKPGLGGQRAAMLPTPVLADLAWRIYQVTEELAFLEEAFQPLLDYLQTWFAQSQDRDDDGIPEWDHPMQSGFEDNPTFAPWHSWAQGADITYFESPALCALLYKECRTLLKMAELLGRTQHVPSLQAQAERLTAAVKASWNNHTHSYHYWDRETHRSHPGRLLGRRTGPGEIFIDKSFRQPLRLLLRIETSDERAPGVHLFLHGVAGGGQHLVQRIEREDLQWHLAVGSLTSEHVFAEVERVRIEGIGPQDRVSVRTVDYRRKDITLLAPLWAGIPDKARARTLIERYIFEPQQYARLYGLPACPQPPKRAGAAVCASVWFPWNVMIGEALLAYEQREAAADLLGRLMTAIVRNLKEEAAFRAHYHADNGQPLGERSALTGLPPLGLFLETLGVRIHSPWRVSLNGFNPFPWPVKLQYRGLTVVCDSDQTEVLFPDGQAVMVDDPAPCTVDGRRQVQETASQEQARS